jgi:four helix bundle protein
LIVVGSGLAPLLKIECRRQRVYPDVEKGYWIIDSGVNFNTYLKNYENMVKSIVAEKSYSFAIRIVNLYKWLIREKKEYVLSKQLLRSGTAIGALLREAEHAQSKPDFLSKVNIALKEANETVYWLMLLKDTTYITQQEFMSINADAEELLKLLTSIVKTTKLKLER